MQWVDGFECIPEYANEETIFFFKDKVKNDKYC